LYIISLQTLRDSLSNSLLCTPDNQFNHTAILLIKANDSLEHNLALSEPTATQAQLLVLGGRIVFLVEQVEVFQKLFGRQLKRFALQLVGLGTFECQFLERLREVFHLTNS
jgi:hypothetical protein